MSDTVDDFSREVMWRLGDDGLEHVRVVAGGETVLVDGVQVWRDDEGGRRVRYLLRCDASWRVRELHVDTPEQGGSLSLRGDGEGAWTDWSGAPLPELDGCVDVDVYAAAFTNTLPLRRLRPAVGEERRIAVAFVRVPSLEVRRVEQRHTRLDARTYRYEGLETGFVADLEVDEDGLVVAYPGLAQRLWAL